MAKKVELAARVVGLAAVAGAASLALCLVHEQPWPPWHSGSQGAGDSLFDSGFGFIGMVGVLVGLVWAIAVVGIALATRKAIGWIDGVLLAVLAASIGLLYVPHDQWQLQTALGAAVVEGQVETARKLIGRGARVDIRTNRLAATPLLMAARMNHMEMVRLLLEHGADREARDESGRNAFDWASSNGNAEMVELLFVRPAPRG